jgi:hypothetical protein
MHFLRPFDSPSKLIQEISTFTSHCLKKPDGSITEAVRQLDLGRLMADGTVRHIQFFVGKSIQQWLSYDLIQRHICVMAQEIPSLGVEQQNPEDRPFVN